MEPARALPSGSRFGPPARDHHIRRASGKAPVNLYPFFEWRNNVVPGTQISYLRTVLEVNKALELAEGPFGFDVEWRPTFVKGQAQHPIALLQLARPDQIYLIHLSAMPRPTFPAQLQQVLEDPKVVKAGVGIAGDAKKLWCDYGVSLLGAVELSHFARRADIPRWESGQSHELISLTRLLEAYNSHRLRKGKTRMSNWELQLNPQQIDYAASDALAGFIVYQHLLDLNSQVHPHEYTSDIIAACGITVATGVVFHLWFSTESYALDAPEFPVAEAEKVDPATSINFPTILKLQGEPEMTLLGVGVRTVSFLSIRVYSVGFYADLASVDLKSLRLCKDAEECIDTLLKTTSCALRIVPTRATSYSHLRDGFVRALQARQALGRKTGALVADQEEALHGPLQEFKGLFPTAAFKKHEPMHIVLSSPKAQPRQLRIPPLGMVQDTWVATEFFRAYFQGTISPPLIADVKENVDNIRLTASS